MIVEAAPVVSGPRPADRNIASNAAEDDGLYRPSRHLERIRDSFERQGKDPEAFVRSHVRRLEALRRAGQVEKSMPIIGRSRRTSSRVGKPTTSARAATG